MCGIVGFVDSRKKKEKDVIIKEMADKIIHRGPDGEGYYTDDVVALGHRRLSIIDVDGGAQPIYSKDKSKMIIFNGEIYNYEILKTELSQKGYKFATKTDTEVILCGYEEWGSEVTSHLRGMFTFVIYDKKKKELFGARDHFGMKPFYYYLDDGVFLFGSEIKSFLAYPDFKKSVNKDALKMYLIFQYSVKEETFFKNVFKLKPGHSFTYNLEDGLTINKYFSISYDKHRHLDYDNMKSELTNVLESSIYYHQTTSDVPVGAYLSGGVDSSYVVSVAKPEKTFSVGFSYEGFDETDLAHELSEELGIKNYRKKISPEDFFEALPSIMWHTDEPHANLSTVPLYFLSDLTRKHVKVALAGEGSDEMFGGYNEYNDPFLLRLYLHVPLFIRKGVRGLVRHLPHFPGRNTLVKYGLPFDERYIGHGTFMEEWEANKILASDLRNNETIASIIDPVLEPVKKESELTKKMFVDFHFWLPQDILLKADKMSMAHSIELRTPLMDKDVFRYASVLPDKFLLKNKETKYIFRDIASKKIPEKWSKRRKCGFPVPFSKWLREEKFYQKVKEAFTMDFVSEFFDKEYINELLDKHYQNIENNGRKIYNIYCFLIWYQEYFIKN
mgnify:FL=1